MFFRHVTKNIAYYIKKTVELTTHSLSASLFVIVTSR